MSDFARRIEDELKEIAEIKEILSTSRSGISVVNVELAWNLSEEEIEQIWSEVRDALSDATENFPPGAGEPGFDNDRTAAFAVISALVPEFTISAYSTPRYSATSSSNFAASLCSLG